MNRLISENIIKLCLIIALSFLGLSGFSQYKFTINVKSTTLEESKIYFSILSNTSPVPLHYDSTYLKNGFVKIAGQIAHPSSMANLTLRRGEEYLLSDFVIDSGENDINLEIMNDSAKSVRLISNRKGNLIYEEIVALHRQGFELSKANDTVESSEKVFARILDRQRKNLERHPNDFASVLLLYRLGRFDFTSEFAKKILATLGTFNINLKSSALGKTIYEEKTNLIKNIESVKIGQQVIGFKVIDIKNKLFNNASLNGSSYLIIFSATWCIPCQEMLPDFKKLYSSNNDKGFKIVYFNLDDDVKRWKDHVRQNKLDDWINVSEKVKFIDSKIAHRFGIYKIPSFFLVDKKGLILYNSEEQGAEFAELEKYMKTNKIIF